MLHLTVQHKVCLTVALNCVVHRICSVREFIIACINLLEERYYILLDSCKNSDVLLSTCRTCIFCHFDSSTGCIDFLMSTSHKLSIACFCMQRLIVV